MRPLLSLALCLSGCIIIDADATDPPDGAPRPDAALLPDARIPPPPHIDAGILTNYCPAPDPGRVMVCGRVLDLAISSEVGWPLRIEFHDALILATSAPGQAPPPLMVTSTDAEGRFHAVASGQRGIAGAPTFIAVVTDDLGGVDMAIPTLVVTQRPSAGETIEVLAFAAPRDSVFADYEDSGAIVSIFLDVNQPSPGWLPGTPVAGVTVTEQGEAYPQRDEYFVDVSANLRSVLGDSASSTGVNGSAIYTGGPITAYGGSSPGCDWPSQSSGPVPGHITVSLFEAECGR